MKRFAMLITQPAYGEEGERRFFIDGDKVDEKEYSDLARVAVKIQAFNSYEFAGRFHIRSEVYV